MSADGKVPELDGLVVAAGDDDEVVEPEAGDAVGMRSERDESLAGLETPHLDRLVVRGRDDAPPVRLQTADYPCKIDQLT